MLALALGACGDVVVLGPEDVVEGDFEGALTADCRCFGDPPRFSLSCAGSEIEIDGVEQRMVFDIEFFQTTANTRGQSIIMAWVGDMRGYAEGTGWWGSEILPDPRAAHTERYRILGFDTLRAPEQPFLRPGESYGIEHPGFIATDVRMWCEASP